MAKRQAGDRFTIIAVDNETGLAHQYQIGYWEMVWAYRSQAEKIAKQYQTHNKGCTLVVVPVGPWEFCPWEIYNDQKEFG